MVKFLVYSLLVFTCLPTPGWSQTIQRQTLLRPFSAPINGKIKVAFFDADSTLRISKSGSPSANGPLDYIILPGVSEKIAELNSQGYFVAIVSNQAGIPKFVTLEGADGALSNMSKELKEKGATVHYFDFAENNDEFRKPQVGMANRLESVLKKLFGESVQISLPESFMVGDSAYKKAQNGKPGDMRPDGRPGFNFSNSDRLFAENLGIRFLEPQTFFGWEKYGVELIENQDHLTDLLNRMAPQQGICGSALNL